MKDDLVVVKHNDILNASYRLSLIEQRVILACIAQLDSKAEEVDQITFEVSVSEIADLVGKGSVSGSAYDRMKDALERLWRREITMIPTGDKDEQLVKLRWIQRLDYRRNAGKVRLTFADGLLPYLTQLKANFTKYKLEYVAHFKSSHSIRIYELLVQWMSAGEREISVEELREKLALGDRYPVVSELKRNVLDKAVKDINKYSNIRVKYGQRKTGRTVTSFQFKFRLKESGGASGSKKMTTHAPSKVDQLKQGSTTDARPGESMAEYLTRKKRESK